MLGSILEEKELIRINIRALREYYCVLMFHEPLKRFRDLIDKNQEEEEKTR